jgi:hypothetical protein
MKPDITYAMNESEANFVAETPAGEKFLGKPEINIPVHRTGEYVEKAVEAGLIVLPFP